MAADGKSRLELALHDGRDNGDGKNNGGGARRRGRDSEEPSRERKRSRSRERDPQAYDDADGHLIINLGDEITSRYKILQKMGEGTFAQVVECWDRHREQFVAIKVVRNIPKYRDAAKIEIELLQQLHAQDPTSSYRCILLLKYFDFRHHVCMVFTRHGPSIYEFLKRLEYRPLSYQTVRDISFQIIQGVAFLHSIKLVHTDLKPENIVFERPDPHAVDDEGRGVPASSNVVLIDFGSATYEDYYHSTVVSTRHYRAPEVILGIGWSYPCDVWSLGCIIIELFTGEAAFQTHDNAEHLAMMERLLGPIPTQLTSRAHRHCQKYFDTSFRLRWPELAKNASSNEHVERIHHIEDVMESEPQLLHLIRQMLAYNPDERISAAQALNHPYFRNAPGLSDEYKPLEPGDIGSRVRLQTSRSRKFPPNN